LGEPRRRMSVGKNGACSDSPDGRPKLINIMMLSNREGGPSATVKNRKKEGPRSQGDVTKEGRWRGPPKTRSKNANDECYKKNTNKIASPGRNFTARKNRNRDLDNLQVVSKVNVPGQLKNLVHSTHERGHSPCCKRLAH